MAHEAHGVHFKQYIWTWFWLLVLTCLALGIGYVSMPAGIKGALLVSTTLFKVVLIATIFMHLRFEKLNLVLLTFSPIILSIILFFFLRPDTSSALGHFINVR